MATLETKHELKKKKDIPAKLDLVTIQDGAVGEVMEVYITHQSRSYKIRKLENDEVVYFDETKVTLKRRHFRNLLNKLFAK